MVGFDLKKLQVDEDSISMVSTSVSSTRGGGGTLGKQPCNRCGVLWRWNKMHSWKVWEEAEDDWGDSEYN